MAGMHLMRRRWFAVVFWLAALVACVLVGVWASGVAMSMTPDAVDPAEEASTSGAELVYGAVGFVVGLLGTIAVAAAIWLGLWAAERRAGTATDHDDEHDPTADDGADLDDFLTGAEEDDQQDGRDTPGGLVR